jgi:hypothetical protein
MERFRGITFTTEQTTYQSRRLPYRAKFARRGIWHRTCGILTGVNRQKLRAKLFSIFELEARTWAKPILLKPLRTGNVGGFCASTLFLSVRGLCHEQNNLQDDNFGDGWPIGDGRLQWRDRFPQPRRKLYGMPQYPWRLANQFSQSA